MSNSAFMSKMDLHELVPPAPLLQQQPPPPLLQQQAPLPPLNKYPTPLSRRSGKLLYLEGGPQPATNEVMRHNPYKWPYKGITATAISGVIILLITGRGPPCKICHELIFRKLTYPTFGEETSFSKSVGWYPGYVRSLKGHNFPNTIAQSRSLDGCQHILKYIPNLPTPFKQKGQGQR